MNGGPSVALGINGHGIRLLAGGARDVAGHDANGAGEVADFDTNIVAIVGFSVEFPVDGRKGAEELLDDVGEGGSALGGDAAGGEQDEESAEDALDVRGSVELALFAEEYGNEIERVAIVQVKRSMAAAKGSRLFDDGEVALAAGGGAMEAAGKVVGGDQALGSRIHELGDGDRMGI